MQVGTSSGLDSIGRNPKVRHSIENLTLSWWRWTVWYWTADTVGVKCGMRNVCGWTWVR